MPADMTLASSSTQFVTVPVQATVNGVPYNPTGDTVSMAFVTGPVQPLPQQFNSGSWSTTIQGSYLAMCLVGPSNGGVVLVPGTYVVWVKVSDAPEVPIMPSGTLTIT